VLDRLKEDLDLNKWIREGYDLHMNRNEFDHCLFCQNQIAFSLLDRFSKHYSPEYRDLQKKIDTLVSELKNLKISNVYISYADFYPDLRNNCKNLTEQINNTVVKIIDWRDSVTDVLLQKSNNPFESDLEIILEDPGNLQNELENSLKELNQLIKTHNKSIAEHPKRVNEAKEKLEIHTIATALSEQDFPKMVKDLEAAIRVEQEASLALENLEKEMMPLESKTSNIGIAIKEINQHIKDFFGRQEIILQLDSLKKGYTIKRNGIPATNLSEGEKTAIAFSYFIVKVKENDNKIKDTILFIDDPMSSLDTNFIYHCFALITTQFQEALQLFISTHNFQFFNLVKEWYIKKNNQIKRDNQKLLSAGKPVKSLSCEFYMIENYTDKDKRKGKLTELDKTLREYKSEYHFLFAQLNRFKDADLTYADCYTIGNIARRFFDIYADFKIPDHRDQRQKMEEIVKFINASEVKIGQVEYNKAYKLINEFSHNSDPTSTIEHKDKTECKEAINTILKIVQESDNKHYQILEESLHD
jgi:wobble nucleotide-excising tRNase